MKLAQRKIKWLARLMLVLVLFAQGIVAADACDMFTSGPEQAYAIERHDDAAMPCHEEKNSNANACLVHCTQSEQISADQHHVPVAAPVSVIAWVSTQPQTQHVSPAIFSGPLVLDTGPPIPIRFCSLLN